MAAESHSSTKSIASKSTQQQEKSRVNVWNSSGKVYANNVIGPTSAYGNNLADPASSQTFDSGYVAAVGDEAEHRSMARVRHLAVAAATPATHRSTRPPLCSALLS